MLQNLLILDFLEFKFVVPLFINERIKLQPKQVLHYLFWKTKKLKQKCSLQKCVKVFFLLVIVVFFLVFAHLIIMGDFYVVIIVIIHWDISIEVMLASNTVMIVAITNATATIVINIEVIIKQMLIKEIEVAENFIASIRVTSKEQEVF